MFDDICMFCGKFLDSGLVYCNDICESADRNYSSSPSLSSTSSVFTSPYISSAAAASALTLSDVPPLMLNPKRISLGRSSSSTSSDVTSVFEYDYDDDDLDDSKSELVYPLPPLDAPEHDPGTIKISQRNSSFSFARRPSHSDNRTLVPVLHPRAADTTTRPNSHAHPSRTRKSSASTPPKQQAASHDVASHRHSRSHDVRLRGSTPIAVPVPVPIQASHALPEKTKRMRASLPAYFSHLALSSHGPRSPPATLSVNVSVNAHTDVQMTPKASRRHARVMSEQFVYAADAAVGRSDSQSLARGRDGYSFGMHDSSSASYGRAMPIPGLHDSATERGELRMDRYRNEDGVVEGERRGRSRVVTPRAKVLSS
ncbi:hypothetical protein K439DRAFT_243469 [Ramaria rubella]|nr:hypothetical protein K439DRAFT_243469 [Ramaria rubella]